MNLEPEQIDRLGIYFVHFEIHSKFGMTFEQYLIRYSMNPHASSVKNLKEDANLIKQKKAATIALVTA